MTRIIIFDLDDTLVSPKMKKFPDKLIAYIINLYIF